MIELRDYQQQLVADIRAKFATVRRVLAVAGTGSGKCLARGTPVLLHDGRVKAVEDIRVGDVLMGPDSGPRTVLSICSGREEMFRVTPRRGEPHVVNRSHILSLKMTGSTNRCDGGPGAIVNLSVDDYMSRTGKFKHCAKLWRAAVDFSPHEEPLRLDPWFFGAWLGDGMSRGAGITTADAEIADAIRAYAASCGLTVREELNSANSTNLYPTGDGRYSGRGHRTNPITLALHQYGVLRNKHVPHRFKSGSRWERLELLAGLMDTDGSWSGRGFDLTLKSKRLMEDIVFVARSLGFSANPAAYQKTCTNNGVVGTYWRCTINGPVDQIPCRVARKKASPRLQKKNPLLSGFSLESQGDGEYFGFEIAGPDRLFLLGDFTVTHNTVTFAYLTRATAAKDKRVIIVAHRAEITRQISAALDAMGVRHGRIQPGHKMTDDPVQVGMIQTVWNRMGDIQRPHLLIVDEAHHAVAGAWSRLTDAWQGVFILGVTATPERLDGRGLRAAFDEMVLAPPVRDLIAGGYLARYRYLAPPADIDLSGVSEHGGDYDIGELAAAMDKPVITGSAVEHYRKHLDGRPAIAFCTTVAHAQHVAEQFAEAGLRAASIDGTMSQTERQFRLAGIGNGGLNVLTSCDLISEGVDVPVVGGALLLRPTKSLAFHLQTVGRVLRPKPDGSEAVILDHVGNFRTHGMPDDLREWSLDSKKRKSREAGTKQCEVCYTVFGTAAPKWRATAVCPRGLPLPEDCALTPEEGAGGRQSPEEVDGSLEEITPPSAAPPPDLTAPWSDGLCIRTGPFKRVLALARTEAQLREMAEARKYDHRWVRRILAFRASREPAVEIPFVPSPPRHAAPPTPAPVRRPTVPVDEMEFLLS